MNILRVASELYPYSVGGIGVHISDISNDQISMGHTVTIYSCLQNENMGIIREANPTVYNLGRKWVLFGNTFCLNLFPLLSKTYSEYDIIHAHSHLYISTLLCAIIRRVKPCKLVITNHGLISQSVPTWFQNLYNTTLGRFIFSSADAIISYTKEEKDVMVSLGINPDKIHIIHNGIKVERFLDPKIIARKRQILWIGRYVPGKGAKYLLEGFAKFSATHPDYSLLMIGNGPEKADMADLIMNLGISKKVTMVDFIPNDKLQDIYQESEIFISSSLAEGVPKTMLEAMVCGLPIISTDLPQLIDIVDECGIIIPCRNSDAIASALEQMISSPENMRVYGEHGRKKVLENYDWNDSVKKTTKLFEDLISETSEK